MALLPIEFAQAQFINIGKMWNEAERNLHDAWYIFIN